MRRKRQGVAGWKVGVSENEGDATESPQTGSLQTSNRELVIATNRAEVARNMALLAAEHLLLTLLPRLNKLTESSCDSTNTATYIGTRPYVMRAWPTNRVLDTILESYSKLTAIKVPRQHSLRGTTYIQLVRVTKINRTSVRGDSSAEDR